MIVSRLICVLVIMFALSVSSLKKVSKSSSSIKNGRSKKVITKSSTKTSAKKPIFSKAKKSKPVQEDSEGEVDDDDDDNDEDNNNKEAYALDIVKPFDDEDNDMASLTKISDDNGGSSLMKSSFDLTKKLAYSMSRAGKSIVKSTVDLCVVKHVTLDQLYGKWLIRQEVEVRKGIFVSCPATILFKEEDGTVVTMFEGAEYKSKFIFKERKWPLKCTIKFEAKAFQESEGAEPVRLLYKGYFKGSLTNPGLLLMRGKIYRLSGKMFKKQVRCGEFRATKRRYN